MPTQLAPTPLLTKEGLGVVVRKVSKLIKSPIDPKLNFYLVTTPPY